MNREIKFRAWNKELEEMQNITSMYWYKRELNCIMDEFDDEGISINDIELMQYTGLKDKNDIEIYEGDILQAEYTNCSEIHVIDSIENYIKLAYIKYIDKIKVIGNIYENKDLLEEVTNE